MRAPPRVAALVLAAGRSSRMSPHNKLLLRDAAGRAMVARVAMACAASRACPVIVVTGHWAAEVTQAVREEALGPDTCFVHAPGYAAGLSASLQAGVEALPPWADGVVVALGDMPLVGTAMIDRMIGAFDPATSAAVVPVWQGQRGNPVLWNRALFGEFATLSGDTGGKVLLDAHASRVVAVEADGPGVLTDYDTLASLPGCWRAEALASA